ncbi:tRNA (cytidine/uridine-2'-O-)-methyltransferase TrmJ [mine drainage metagenome]|uniref:tRNA (Cytidine/uridine-2'-O-)-methyltransferase TrmJ n=1 Tax=mine drainage metagenome TaxID=410659 RepID=A0A1J5QHJ5_9ZZZZ
MNTLARIRIVLCQTSHPGNIGSAARAMKTMGLSELHLVRPHKFPHADANAMSAGATDILDGARVCDSLEQALAGCTLVIGLTARRRELSHRAASPRETAALCIAAEQDVALVFGNETSGLSNEELILCQHLVHIPANPDYSSLNLASAVQIMAYELRMALLGEPRQVEPANPYKRIKPATHDEIEGFYGHLEQTLVEVGYLDPGQPGRLMSRLRRLFTRAGLQQEEVNILRGILKAVHEK